jgi:plastocyanin
MRKFLAVLVVMALAPFALAACGGDDEEEEPAATAPAETTEEAAGGGGAAETVEVSADPGGSLAFEQNTLSASAGPTTFEFANDATLGHDFCLERDGEDVGCTDVISGDTDVLEADLESGEYTFYCSVSGHREGGMEGTLTVK